MALANEFQRESIKTTGQKLTYGEYPAGKAVILEAKSSTKPNSTWLRMKLEVAGQNVTITGDICDFRNPEEPLLQDDTFDVKNWMYGCVDGERPFFLPVSEN